MHATTWQFSSSPMAAIRSLLARRALIANLARREVAARYRGALLGMLWSFLTPLLMLALYTFVFTVVFEARWGQGTGDRTEFALVLFCGMLVHQFFAEVLTRAPLLILQQANFVKKVVFPLEVLPPVMVISALFHLAVSAGVLLLAQLLFTHTVHLTALLLPLVVAPLILLGLGVAWMLSALGVYMRDIAQTMGLVATVLMFLSPVFYPVTALPERVQAWIYLNPLTLIIEEARKVTLWGELPDIKALLVYSLVAAGTASIGFAWFQKTRKGFADVL